MNKIRMTKSECRMTKEYDQFVVGRVTPVRAVSLALTGLLRPPSFFVATALCAVFQAGGVPVPGVG